jgi:branched-chain amino acid transport system permease protein
MSVPSQPLVQSFEPTWKAWLRSVVPVATAIVLALLAKFWLEGALGLFNSRVAVDVGIAIVLAVSLNIVNGLTGQFSIGHAGFFALGGYAAGALTYYGSLLYWGDARIHGGWLGAGEWFFLFNCLVGGIFAASIGYLVGLPSLRLRGDYLAIVTLGFGEIVRVLLQQTNDVLRSAEAVRDATAEQLFPPPVGGSLGFDSVPTYTSLFWVVLWTSLTVIAAHRIKQSSTGRALVSIREDEIAAQAMGINITRLKVRAFVYSAFFAGIAGGLYAHVANISPRDAGFQRSFDIVIMVVLGGMGSISGVTLAAAALTVLPEFLRDFENYRLIIYAASLILMMILRPQGLFGFREIWDYFPWRRPRATAAKGDA